MLDDEINDFDDQGEDTYINFTTTLIKSTDKYIKSNNKQTINYLAFLSPFIFTAFK